MKMKTSNMAMFWLHKEGDQEIVSVQHIDGKIVGRKSTGCRWGHEHPFGWESIHSAVTFLQDKFAEKDMIPHEVTEVKEKYGRLTVYSIIGEGVDSLEKGLDAVRELIQEFPGVEDYLEIDFLPEVDVFSGTPEQCSEWIKNHADDTDEELMKFASG